MEASLCSRMRCKLPSNTSTSIFCIDYTLNPNMFQSYIIIFRGVNQNNSYIHKHKRFKICVMNFFEKVKTNNVLKIIHVSHDHCSSVDYGIQHFVTIGF
jgi:hypothetical protein